MKRKRMSKRASKRNFSGNAGHHPKNTRGRPQRGGIRL